MISTMQTFSGVSEGGTAGLAVAARSEIPENGSRWLKTSSLGPCTGLAGRRSQLEWAKLGERLHCLLKRATNCP